MAFTPPNYSTMNMPENQGNTGTNPVTQNDDGSGELGREFDYTAVHPPTPSNNGFQDANLRNTVFNAENIANPATAAASLGQFWAQEIGANWGDEWDSSAGEIIEHSEGDTNTEFNERFGSVFESDVFSWQDDWGIEGLTGEWGNKGFPEGDDWETHGGKRKLKVDDPYLLKANKALTDLETSIGYKTNDNETLIEKVYQGYGQEEDINYSALAERVADPSIVIGSQNEEGKLIGGELSRENASGAWGNYLMEEEQADTAYTQDKEDAKEDYDMTLQQVRQQRQALGQQLAPQLQGLRKKGSLAGFRRGGRRAGGYTRAETEAFQAQAKELGGLRQQARRQYQRKLERLAVEKKQTLDTAVNTLEGKVESEIQSTKGILEVAENTYDIEHLGLEQERAASIYNTFGQYEQADTDWPWPSDPNKQIEDE